MRIDRFFSELGILSRKECAKALKQQRIRVNDILITKGDYQINENQDLITLDGNRVEYSKFIYIMLNKPQGYICSTETNSLTVLDLLPDNIVKRNVFPCGRLDIDTVGLVILTNNGKQAHNLLSPAHHVEKRYNFVLADDITQKDIDRIQAGVTLIDGLHTKPCKITMTDAKSGNITVSEGKYHQIKRMFASVGNKVEFLERQTFGKIELDKTLKRGEFRELTPEEISYFESVK